MTLTDKAILVVLMVGNTSCYGGECMMMMQSLQSIAIFPPKKTIFPQHSYRDIMDRQHHQKKMMMVMLLMLRQPTN